MHKNATKCNKIQSKWCINKHGALKIIDTFAMYQGHKAIMFDVRFLEERKGVNPLFFK
jgi:hypothetical protein